MDAMAEIRQTFFEECAEQLAELEAGLLAMENGVADSDTVNAVFRAVHSIKGGAGAFSLDELVRFAHVFETTLDELRSDRLEASDQVIKVMLRAADALADLVTAARDDGVCDAERNAGLVQELKALVGGKASEAEAPAQDDGIPDFDFVPVAVDLGEMLGGGGEGSYRIVFRPHAALYANANDAVRILRDLAELGETTVTCDTSELPGLEDLDPEGAYLSFTIDLQTDQNEDKVREVFDFVEGNCDLSIEALVEEAEEEDGAGVDSDLADLLARIRGDATPEPAKRSVPEPVAEPVAEAVSGPTQDSDAAPSPARAATPAAKVEPADPKTQAAAANTGQTIRVDLERVDRLIDLVGELVIHQVMLSQRAFQAGLARASDVAVALDELEQLTREIQDSVMAIRAQPVKSVFQRLPRLVREVADIAGKSVRLVTEGEATEVDKTVIERLSDPLTHMIRNAIDHGLEKPEVRREAGKAEEGTVRVAAMHRSGRIVIEISDDGAGINRKKVREIAIEKGLVPADASLSDEEIDNLIFMPGFSTATEISELSGRGVGMDVVKRSIQALGGRVSINSKPGRGSTFTMSLPLTLAVLDGMIVSVGDQTAVVPLTAIVETLQPKPEEVKSFGGDARLIKVRDTFLPLVDVARELAYSNDTTSATTGVAILVEAENGTRSALLVDAIQGQRQVVIKSLEANYGRVPGIAAATILGDGRVALILDVDAIVATSRLDGAFNPGLQHAAE
ncbi:chemotaxis protein CheA [Aurantimonas sp. HBX-1]|uniref:chemotaxis protein CheA n=1 Tax=Aurantimonas sp. HBX-1 TaxID=2906072 RepID=UPI001F2F451D|nr:chemotaxis protein CheA [Aurantimonas sp. HBX-1]UIJ72879.1 chemotaxis protein CheA [Aurantimonas sp. HBX-1]